eukprot:TRINITY_DN640_c0_g1_i1.p1 TRINITY_DN640_c0_g1~~TRINITY_DN640_c0_g1_i1.p1  ORF type:complete len:521 (-),score=145.29 TRINITY_DN640_c0_g1_i1:97-1515(-)
MSTAKAPLMVSPSGIRGISNKSLVPSVVEKYVSALMTLLRQKVDGDDQLVVIGRDSRVTGPWVSRIVEGVVMAHGYNVLQVGIVATPTVQYMVQQEKAAAGIVVTSSHNPIDWNGLKFIDSDGLFLRPSDWVTLKKIADGEGGVYPAYEKIGKLTEVSNASERHVATILDLPEISTDKVVEKKFKVVLDTVNGAGGPVMAHLLERLGCEVVALNAETTGVFAHKPEPITPHLTQLMEGVKEHKADIGIATDPDVDRCVVINEKGEPIGEEFTLALAVYYWLNICGKKGAVVKNMSSSRVINDLAEKYGCEIHSAAVGEIFVAETMLEKNAVIGGEGNGGVMLPDVHIGRDAPVAAALILSLLAAEAKPLSVICATFPTYFMSKQKASLSALDIDVDEFLAQLSKKWSERGATVLTLDGVHISTEKWWVHLRKSNTEPIVRVFSEASSEAEATTVAEQFVQSLESGGSYSPRV